jgi:hypothetical protein
MQIFGPTRSADNAISMSNYEGMGGITKQSEEDRCGSNEQQASAADSNV